MAAACGYVIFVGLGDWGGLESAPLSVPGLPDYDGTRITDLLLGAAVGVVTALLLVAVMRLAHGSRAGAAGACRPCCGPAAS